jgi:hypothetical protein
LSATWSLPDGWGAGGAIADGPLTAPDVAAVVEAGLPPASRVVIKPGFLGAEAWRHVDASDRRTQINHVIDLSNGYDEYWQRTLSSATRTKLRRAHKRLDVRWGQGEQYLDEYQDLYLRWSRGRALERGLPVGLGLALARRREPLGRYRTIARRLGGTFRVVLAVHDGQPVAAMLALISGRHAHYWRATNDRDARRGLHASSLLISELAREASSAGCVDLDLGESGGVPSLIDFKETIGGRGRPYDALVLQPRAVTSADHARRWITAQAERAALATARRLRK